MSKTRVLGRVLSRELEGQETASVGGGGGLDPHNPCADPTYCLTGYDGRFPICDPPGSEAP